MDRVNAIEQLAARRFDLLIVGGGIVGAGIAEAATANGLSVALVDKRDFASGTSSASSKLVHGGLRYLQMGDIGLVREAHQERRLLMSVVAPHLVERLPFLFPLYGGRAHTARPSSRTGVLLYSALARARLNGRVSEARALKLVASAEDGEPPFVGALRRRADERRPADDREPPRRRPDAAPSSSTTPRSRPCATTAPTSGRRRGRQDRVHARRSSTRPDRGSTASVRSKIPRPAVDPPQQGRAPVVDGGEDWRAA